MRTAGAIKVDGTTNQGTGSQAEEHAQRPTQDADEHPDQPTAGRSRSDDLVLRLGDVRPAVGRAGDDNGGTDVNPAPGACRPQLAEGLISVALLPAAPQLKARPLDTRATKQAAYC